LACLSALNVANNGSNGIINQVVAELIDSRVAKAKIVADTVSNLKISNYTHFVFKTYSCNVGLLNKGRDFVYQFLADRAKDTILFELFLLRSQMTTVNVDGGNDEEDQSESHVF
jgi:hypothetical protein